MHTNTKDEGGTTTNKFKVMQNNQSGTLRYKEQQQQQHILSAQQMSQNAIKCMQGMFEKLCFINNQIFNDTHYTRKRKQQTSLRRT